MSYPCSSMAADGRVESVNRNAFVGANLGVHASPLEAVTSMDPKDYVWGGGYNSSFYGCQSSAIAGAQPCYYQSPDYPGRQGGLSSQGHYGELIWLHVSAKACSVAANLLHPVRQHFDS